jgi:hypothetical protein
MGSPHPLAEASRLSTHDAFGLRIRPPGEGVLSGIYTRLGGLTENLYKFRAYIDEPTFNMLHRFKRIMQDAHALMDRCTRGDYWEHRDDPSILLSLAKDTGIDLEAEAIVTDDNKGPASAIGPNSPEDEEMSYELKSKIQRKI